MASRLNTRTSSRNDVMKLLSVLLLVLFSCSSYAEPPEDPPGHGLGHDHDGGTSTSDASALANALATGGEATGGVGSATVNSKVLSVSGSGMEIRDCIATHAILFGLWQGTHVNKPCIADNMDARGQYDAAAKLRCSMWSYKRIYGRGQKCIDAIIVSAPDLGTEPDPEPELEPVVPPDEEEEEEEDAATIHAYVDINARLDAMDAARAANVKRYNRDKAAQKQADEDFYRGYIEKFEQVQQQEGPADNE